MREAELKHGRIMLAFYGYVLVDLGNTWPGAPEVSSLLAHDAAVKNGSMLALLGIIGVFEALAYVAIAEMMSGQTDRAPGDYNFDPLNFKKRRITRKSRSRTAVPPCWPSPASSRNQPSSTVASRTRRQIEWSRTEKM